MHRSILLLWWAGLGGYGGVALATTASQPPPPWCDPLALEVCDRALESCLGDSGPPLGPRSECECAAVYYGFCLWRAGCSAPGRMVSCEQVMLERDCEERELALCGNNCLEPGQALEDGAVILTVNNWTGYHLRVSVCEKSNVNVERFFGRTTGETCSNRRECDYWIAPETSFVPLAVPLTTSSVTLEYCELGDDGLSAQCHTDPPPKTYYGADGSWPPCLHTDEAPRTQSAPHLCLGFTEQSEVHGS